MERSILVYGYYNHKNMGDELFKLAFETIFPDYQFIFTDTIDATALEQASAVFIGGGSILNENMNIDENLLPQLLKKKIFYLGVGIETEIHDIHRQLMPNAQLIAVRST